MDKIPGLYEYQVLLPRALAYTKSSEKRYSHDLGDLEMQLLEQYDKKVDEV